MSTPAASSAKPPPLFQVGPSSISSTVTEGNGSGVSGVAYLSLDEERSSKKSNCE